ncbi:DotU family type IV/VI secretion system protein [Mangrovicoccus ximenensis]|uniref:DotU family type IV/VI secretion system protein n=1 Tax=Mangrovicoccus ximenensis TaxID=1911570 RepID=UPI002ED5C29A
MCRRPHRFHNETWGGEKVFEILARLKAEPGTHIALLKLIDLVLLLGFEGVHRVLDDRQIAIHEALHGPADEARRPPHRQPVRDGRVGDPEILDRDLVVQARIDAEHRDGTDRIGACLPRHPVRHGFRVWRTVQGRWQGRAVLPGPRPSFHRSRIHHRPR